MSAPALALAWQTRLDTSAHISLIALGVAYVSRATSFHERLGFVRSKTVSEARELLPGRPCGARGVEPRCPDDAQAAELWTGNGGIAIAQNLASGGNVDVMMARAEAAGGRILKQASKTFWGGYDGYVADPDGHVWEVAHKPIWKLDEDGRMRLPD